MKLSHNLQMDIVSSTTNPYKIALKENFIMVIIMVYGHIYLVTFQFNEQDKKTNSWSDFKCIGC